MKILQWSMTIPEEKQEDFVELSKKKLAPTWKKFGCIKYELCKVEDKPIVGRTILEKNRFIERLYFDDGFDIPSFFAKVKANPEAWKLSRMYEGEFGAKDIELRVLQEV